MINFVIKKFLKNLNEVSLSAKERAVLRKEFLEATGLRGAAEQPSLRSRFVLASPKTRDAFELKLVEGFSNEFENVYQDNDVDVRNMGNEMTVKVNLNIFDENDDDERAVTPQTFVIMKIARRKTKQK